METAGTAPALENKLIKSVEISTLCAFYGELLTELQRSVIRLHYDEDWSLAEVADHLHVSRQGVHDLISRSAQKLRHYEETLGCIAQAHRVGHRLRAAADALESAGKLSGGKALDLIGKALAQIRQAAADIGGEE